MSTANLQDTITVEEIGRVKQALSGGTGLKLTYRMTSSTTGKTWTRIAAMRPDGSVIAFDDDVDAQSKPSTTPAGAVAWLTAALSSIASSETFTAALSAAYLVPKEPK